MNKIGDDELGQILSRVTDPDDRKSASEVCTLWRVMEGLSRSSLRVDDLDHLPRLLARYPYLTTFQTHKKMSNADLALVAQSCPKLEAFILEAIVYRVEIGMKFDEVGVLEKMRVVNEVGDEGLCALADGCPNLSKIVLRRNRVGLRGIMAMITSAAHNLTHLDLGNFSNLDQALEAVGSSSCAIRILNLRCCSEITDVGLRFLANGSCSRTIKQLNLSGCESITSVGLSHLCKMRVLEDLNLAFCVHLNDVAGQAISTIQTLKKLNLTRLANLTEKTYVATRLANLTEKTYVALAKNCINLEVLNLLYCGEGVTTASIDAFSGHKCLRSLILVGCLSHDFRGSTLERLALHCPSLESIVVQESFRERLLQEMQESTVSRFLRFVII